MCCICLFFRNYCHVTHYYVICQYLASTLFLSCQTQLILIHHWQIVIVAFICVVDPRALEQSVWPVPHWFEEYVRAVSEVIEGTADEREKREAVGSSASREVDGMSAECGTI